MRKFLATLLLALLAVTTAVFGLTSCLGSKESGKTSESDKPNESTSVETPEESGSEPGESGSELTTTTYTITWMNGETELGTTEVEENELPVYDGETPTKEADAQYTYTFSGWTPEIVAATENAIYTATFTETVNTYTVTWKNGEETLETDTEVAYGTTPEYNGATPTKEATAQYTYTFDAWTPAVTAVTGDATYTATFTENTRNYTVTFDTNGGNEIVAASVPYGTASSALDEIIPTKAGYTFDRWQLKTGEDTYVDLDGTETVTENITVKAVWTANTYYVTFKNGEDIVDTKNVTYNSAIGEFPADPSKLGYTFTGWTIDGDAITAETLYSADTDKIAMANYTLNTVHDNTATFAADFFKTSDADYTLAATAIDAGLDIGDVIAVCYNGNSLDYTTSAGNFVFGNAYIKAMTVGDYVLDVYTATDTYRAKVAIATKTITSVADLQAVANANQADRDANPGYYIIVNDIDGADQGSVKALSYNSATPDNYTTAGFRGILDGRGHVLKNIKLAEGRLFWGIGNNGTVRDLALIDPVQVGASGYIFARDVVHGTISNVIVKAGTERAILGTACGAVVTNCVFILETNGTDVIGTKDDTFAEHAPSVINNIAVVVKSNSGTLNALYGTAYKVEGTYEEYETANNIKDYASVNAMLANIGSSFFDGWNSYITFADNSISFNGQKLVKPTIGLTSAGNEVLVGGNMTFTATDATFSLKEAVAGVSINATTGELSVGSDVEPDTTITVVATSTLNGAYYEEKTVTVALESVDLTANGTYDVELGSAHAIAAIEGDVIAIKTATGTKVTLANANVVTADELNSAAGVKWSEGLAINFYTASKAYTLNAAFITKIIRNISDLKAAADYCNNDRDKNPVYYILANDIDGTDQGKVSAFSYNSTTSTNYTTVGFRGVFDGRGHILKNVELKDNRMFWGIGNNGVVKNFALIDPVFTSTPCILARDVVHGTISNVVVKSSAGSAFIGTACGATIENCVFILEPNGTYLMSSKDDLSNNAASSINNVAIVVKSNSGTLKAVADNFYKPEGATYAEYEAANGIHDYASTTAMLAALASENYIAGWNSPFITFADGKLSFGGTIIV